ncbi:hypothetical protein GF362_00490 [Candidatus Dojkabacteria bacterium]|nr:hypothetical protein [Candidatus Dojkabacteria bacterium]
MKMRIKVYPNKPKTKIRNVKGREDIDLHIDLAAAPENNKANIELVNFLSEHLRVSKSSIQIKSGQKSRIKTVIIE